jgi:Flp pilus assembly protein TadG
MRALRELLKRRLPFWRNERGSVLMIFAFALIPMLVSVGVAVDYSLAARSRAHIASAADAAALAGARAAQNYLNSYGTSSIQWAQAITIGKQTASDVYAANQNLASDKLTIQTQAPQITIAPAPDGTALATVQGFGKISTRFMYLVGIPTVNVGSSSQAQGAGISYYQIVFIVDVSNSMAIGGSQSIIQTMDNNVDFQQAGLSCSFACHDGYDTTTSYYCTKNATNMNCAGYNQAGPQKCTTNNKGKQTCTPTTVHVAGNLSYCPNPTGTQSSDKLQCVYYSDKRLIAKYSTPQILLKIDYVQQAMQEFIQQLSAFSQNQTQTGIYNQFQVSVWTFGTATKQAFSGANTAASATQRDTYYSNVLTAANAVDLEPATSGNNHGYTQTSSALKTVYSSTVSAIHPGDGSTANSRKTYFILLSDGAEDIPGNSQWGRTVVDNYATASTPTACDAMKVPTIMGNDKSRPIVFSIAATYPDIQPSEGDYLQYSTLILNSGMKANIKTAMTNCATPGYSYSADSGDDIVKAVNSAFSSIMASLHLTK